MSLPLPFTISSKVTLENWDLGRPRLFHLVSRDSANADIKKMNSTGDRLFSWQTPTVCGILAFSFPIWSRTFKSVYILSVAEHSLGGHQYCLSISMKRLWFAVS